MPASFQQPAIFTFEALLHCCEGDDVLARDVAALMRAEIDRARRALEDADGDARRRCAHGIKGAALNCGAATLAQKAARLEERPNDQVRLCEMMEELDHVDRALRVPEDGTEA